VVVVGDGQQHRYQLARADCRRHASPHLLKVWRLDRDNTWLWVMRRPTPTSGGKLDTRAAEAVPTRSAAPVPRIRRRRSCCMTNAHGQGRWLRQPTRRAGNP
jgi:hypothetical protein